MKEEIVKEKVSKKINEKIVYVLLNIAKVIALAIIGFLFIAAFTHTAYFYTDKIDFYHEGLFYRVDNFLLNLIGIIVLIGLFYMLNKITMKLPRRYMLISILLIYLIIGVAWVFFVKSPVKSDQAQVLSDAKSFSKGNFDVLKDYSYLYQHPMQLGIVVLDAMIISIFHSDSVILFQILNIICISISCYFLYLMAEDIFDEDKTGKSILIMMLLYPVLFFYSVVVYGNIFGFMNIIIAIYCLNKFLDNKKIRWIVISTVFAIIAYLLKANYEIAIIAMIIILILDFLKRIDFKNLVFITLLMIVIMFSYKILYFGIEIITGYKVNDGIPMITYIAMGMDQKPISRNSGWYGETTNVETIYHASGFSSEDTKNVSKMMINNRLKYFVEHPVIAIKFYQDKICSTWLEPAFQTLWWAEPLEAYPGMSDEYKEYVTNNKLYQNIMVGNAHNILIRYLDFFENMIFITAIVSIIVSFKEKVIVKKYVLLIGFIGGFLFHILWETKCIYVLPFFILLMPYSANGLTIIFEKYNNYLIKRKGASNEKN